MPVIIYVPQDPTDIVIQGEEMRLSAMGAPINNVISPMRVAAGITQSFVLQGSIDFPPMHPDFTGYDSRLRGSNSMISNNAVISTPCGALIPRDTGNILINSFVQGTERWIVTGVTRDTALAPLANCKVTIVETGQMTINGMPVVNIVQSDGSGNYSAEVPRPTAYQGIAYLDGATDAAGASIDNLTLTQV